MPIDLLGVGTDPLPGRFQFATPNRSIGPAEVARDGFKAGWIRIPLLGGRFRKKIARTGLIPVAAAPKITSLQLVVPRDYNYSRSGVFVEVAWFRETTITAAFDDC
jgi:hypothetical protein